VIKKEFYDLNILIFLSESGCPGFKDVQDFCLDLDLYYMSGFAGYGIAE